MNPPHSPGRKLRLLIVEDDIAIAQDYGAVLDDSFSIRLASNLREGKLILQKWEPALLLTDLRLPDGDGIELLRMAQEKPGIGTIAITAFPIEYIDPIINQVSVDRFLQKPINSLLSLKTTLYEAAGIAEKRIQSVSKSEIASEMILTIDEVAKFLRIGRTKVYHLIQNGNLRSVRIGGSRRFRKADIDKWIQNLES